MTNRELSERLEELARLLKTTPDQETVSYVARVLIDLSKQNYTASWDQIKQQTKIARGAKYKDKYGNETPF